MLSKNWWLRHRARVAPLTVVVDPLPELPFHAVALEVPTEHGTYYVDRVGGDWSARFRPAGARPDEREVAVDARDEDGSALDWPTCERAKDACRLHAHLVELGYSVVRATELVAQRSQRPSSEERVETLDYAVPAAARP